MLKKTVPLRREEFRHKAIKKIPREKVGHPSKQGDCSFSDLAQRYRSGEKLRENIVYRLKPFTLHHNDFRNFITYGIAECWGVSSILLK